MVARRPFRETSRRYANLVRRVRNWPSYFLRKLRPRSDEASLYVTRGNRIRFLVPSAIRGAFKEIFMEDVYDLDGLFGALPADPVVVDIGANVGLFCVAAAEFARHPTLIAIEPMPANVDILRTNLSALDSSLATVHCHAAAIAGRDQHSVALHFSGGDKQSVVASTQPGFSTSNTRSIEVPAVTLHGLFELHGIERVHILKMDCEGAEFEVLSDTAPETLAKIDCIVMEVHESETPGHTLASVENMLRTGKFTVESRCLGGGAHLLRARK